MVKRENYDIAAIMSSLSPIVKLLTKEQCNELREHITIKRFKKNDVMYKAGDVPQYFHCLISGKVKVYIDGVGGRSQILRIIKPVECFGYRAYFANENYITAAAAFETSVVCLIPMAAVYEWAQTNIKLAHFFMRLFAIELGSSDQRIVNLTQKHIRGRLAEALLFLKDSYGTEEDGSTLAVCLPREEIANLSNMTTANAIRTLSAFASEELISIKGRHIQLLDEEKLKKISKIG